MRELHNICILVNNNTEFIQAQETLFKTTSVEWAHGETKISDFNSECLIIKNNVLFHRPRRCKVSESQGERVVWFKDLENFLKPKLKTILGYI